MFCPKYSLETWIAYRTRQLDVLMIEELERHLEQCVECLEELLELNRAEARMLAFPQQTASVFSCVDTFTLKIHQTSETFQTLLGEVVFVPAPAIRGKENSTWQYSSSTLGVTLEFLPAEKDFSLTVQGKSAVCSFSGDKTIFSGSLDEQLLFHHLPYGKYTISVEKGSVSFVISQEDMC